ncbi:MAG: hypothetical protein ABIW48_00500 [Burkholderiales bacterium]
MDYRERENVVVIFRIDMWLWLATIAFGTTVLPAEELGRLFFNAAERKAMNEKRLPPNPKPIASVAKRESPAREAKAPGEESESVRLPDPKITGKVLRSSGNNTIWLNHYPQYKRASKRSTSD